MSSPIETDAVIVGAGPVGLFQVFELGLLDIRAHVIESLPQVGGQCSELYPDKPIYDIPALPICGAQELIDRLMEQIRPFSPTFHLGQEVNKVQQREDGRFDVGTSAGTQFIAGNVIIAGGVGSFQPVQVEVPGIDRLLDHSLFYRVKDPARHHGKRLLVVGGGDSALDWTLSLCDQAQSLTLIHRRNEFRAQPNSVNQMHELCAAGKMNFKVAVVADFEADGTQLKRVALKSGQGEPEWIECDHILALLGLTPNLGPIGEWGLEIVRKQVVVDTEKFQTNVPGIFAVGDINSYPGKKKLILSGFHETALAAFAIKERLQPGKKVHLQYTTTSPALQEWLGVRGSDGETSTQ